MDLMWRTHRLMGPLTWIRNQPRIVQLELLAKYGSLKVLASKLSCSESALRPIYVGEPTRSLDWTEEFIEDQFERYRSVRCVAHMNDVSESLVRKCIHESTLILTDLIDYSVGDNSSNKGRRAELEFARLRGSKILGDMNKIEGSQTDFDFLDAELGQVNVKSSRRYSYRAKTRRSNPHYWKFSTSGHSTADLFVCMCYDDRMTDLLGFYMIPTKDANSTNTLTITTQDMRAVDELQTSDQIGGVG